MIKAPSLGSRSDKPDALSEFDSSQRNDDSSRRASAIAGEATSEDLNAAKLRQLTHVFLAGSAALDAFDPEEANRKPNGVAAPPPALADFAASATVEPGTPTTIERPAASTILARPQTVTAPPLRPPVVLPIRRPRIPAYLYAAVALATLILIAGVLLPLPQLIVEQSAKQPLPTRNDAPETPRAREALDATAIVVDPAASPEQETARRPVEESRTADLVAASPPIALRDAPAAAAPSARETRPADPPRQSLPLPAPLTRSVPVPVNTAAANPAAAAAPDAATTRDDADPQPQPVVAPFVAASTSTPSTVAALSLPGAATTATPPTVAAATPASAPANSTPAPINGSITGASAALSTPTPTTTTTPPNPATASSTLDIERGTIRQVLERYRNANNALDARGIQDAWPGVNRRALERAFESLSEQNVSFQSCRIDVNTIKAAAVCGGAVRYVPRIGSRTPRVEQREWTFRLERQRNGWLIEGVDTR